MQRISERGNQNDTRYHKFYSFSGDHWIRGLFVRKHCI